MKTLLLMRHAKSSWKDSDLKDFDRPLNKKGKKDAPMMGHLIKDQELVPEVIFCSPAQRTVQTIEAFVKACGYKGDIQYVDSYYMGEPSSFLEPLTQLPDDVERVLVVGHNPGLEGLLQLISTRVESLSTGAIAYLVLPIKHWHEINDDTEGELVQLWLPRDLRKHEKDKK